MSESVIIRGFHPTEGPIDLSADKLGKNLITQGPEHTMTHEGIHFTLSHYFADIDTDGYGRIRILTPTDVYLHSVFFAMGSVGFTITIYRDTTFTHNAANALVATNRNDNSSNVDPLIEACHTPSGSGSGDVFLGTLPLGTGGKQNVGAGIARDANEVILKRNTAYLIEVQSLADNNKVACGIDFYYRG